VRQLAPEAYTTGGDLMNDNGLSALAGIIKETRAPVVSPRTWGTDLNKVSVISANISDIMPGLPANGAALSCNIIGLKRHRQRPRKGCRRLQDPREA